MSSNDLLNLLDLDGNDPGSKADLEINNAGKTPASSLVPASATALVLDKWGIARGKDCLASNKGLQRLANLGNEKQIADAVADFHGAAFEAEPKLSERCIDDHRRSFIKTMLESPEFKALHASTSLNSSAAELATVELVEKYATARGNLKSEKEPKTAREKAAQEMKREIRMMRDVSGAVQSATEQVDELEEATTALSGEIGGGCGHEPGTASQRDPRRVIANYRRVRNNGRLKSICELAGRFRRFAQAKQRQKSNHGYDDMVGVEMAGDVGRLLPQEMAMLAHPVFKFDAMRRLVEHQSMCRQYRGIEKVAKGPVIVLVDESGSMGSDGLLEKAKALALAMAWIAKHQRRWTALVSWASKGQLNILALPPKGWDEEKLMAWLSGFLQGGTDPPLEEMPEIYQQTKAPVGKTDILMITDGETCLDPRVVEKFKAWKITSKARMTTLSVGCSVGDLEQVSDDSFQVGDINLDEAGVQSALSI